MQVLNNSIIQQNFEQITTSPEQKGQLKQELQTFSNEELLNCLKNLCQWSANGTLGMEMHALIPLLSDLVDLERIESIFQTGGQTAYEIARQKDLSFRWLPSGVIEPKEVKKGFFSSFLAVITNLFNLVFDVFDFTDPSRMFTSLWEKYLIFEVIFRVVQLICYLGQYVVNGLYATFITSIPLIYGIAFLILGALSLAAYAYNRWVRDPFEMAGLLKFSSEWQDKLIVERSECKDVRDGIHSGKNPLLVAPSGAGKSSVIRQAVKVLEQTEPDKTFLKIDNQAISISNSNYNLDLHFKKFVDLAKAHPKKLVYVLDNLQTILELPGGYRAVYSLYKNAKESGDFQIIAALTEEEWKKLCDLDISGVLTGNTMHKIELKKETDEQVARYLWNTYWTHGSDLMISESAIKRIAELFDNSALVARPERANDFLKDLIEQVRKSLTTDIISDIFNETYATLMRNGYTQKATDIKRGVEEEKALIQLFQESRNEQVAFQFQYVKWSHKDPSELTDKEKVQYLLANALGINLVKEQMDNTIETLLQKRKQLYEDLKLRGELSACMITAETVDKYYELKFRAC